MANAIDLDGDFVAVLEQHWRRAGEAYAVRRAGEDHRAGGKPGAAAEELDQRRHIEDHVFGVPVLHHLAVEDGLDTERVRVGNLVARHQHRAKRTECVKRFTAAPLAAAATLLPVARTDVVGAGIAKHIVKRVGLRDIFTVRADDHRQLALVVHRVALELGWQQNRVAGVLHSARHFHEKHRMFRDSRSTLLGMFAIVEAYTQNGCWLHRREQFFHRGRVPGIVVFAENTALDSRHRTVYVLSP